MSVIAYIKFLSGWIQSKHTHKHHSPQYVKHHDIFYDRRDMGEDLYSASDLSGNWVQTSCLPFLMEWTRVMMQDRDKVS